MCVCGGREWCGGGCKRRGGGGVERGGVVLVGVGGGRGCLERREATQECGHCKIVVSYTHTDTHTHTHTHTLEIIMDP